MREKEATRIGRRERREERDREKKRENASRNILSPKKLIWNENRDDINDIESELAHGEK